MNIKNKPTTGVLLTAYGSPERLENVREFYTDIRAGRAPSEELIHEIESRYRRVGGQTPLIRITRLQTEKVQEELERLRPGIYRVYMGMKHSQPKIKDTVQQMMKDRITKIVALVLTPHYSVMSIGEYQRKLQKAMDDLDYHPELRFVESWHKNPHLITCITEQLGKPKGIVVFTSHSLPVRILESGDPYRDQLFETSRLIAEKCGPSLKWELAFQSAGRTDESWLGPDVKDILIKLAEGGLRQVTICPIGFVTDNLELLYDLDIVLFGQAEKLGVTLQRTPSRNTHPEFIKAIVTEVIHLETK